MNLSLKYVSPPSTKSHWTLSTQQWDLCIYLEKQFQKIPFFSATTACVVLLFLAYLNTE